MHRPLRMIWLCLLPCLILAPLLIGCEQRVVAVRAMNTREVRYDGQREIKAPESKRSGKSIGETLFGWTRGLFKGKSAETKTNTPKSMNEGSTFRITGDSTRETTTSTPVLPTIRITE